MSRQGSRKGTSGEEPQHGGERKGLGRECAGPGPGPARIQQGQSKDAGSPPEGQASSSDLTAFNRVTPAAGWRTDCRGTGKQKGPAAGSGAPGKCREQGRRGTRAGEAGRPPAAIRTVAGLLAGGVQTWDGSSLLPRGDWPHGAGRSLVCRGDRRPAAGVFG